jgi:hypothetical protein
LKRAADKTIPEPARRHAQLAIMRMPAMPGIFDGRTGVRKAAATDPSSKEASWR